MVKRIIALVVFCSLVLLIGCSKETFEQSSEKHNEQFKQNLNLRISKPEGQNYTVYKEIKDDETVTTIMDILLNVPWEYAEVQMSRQPDYKIQTINIDHTVSYEPVTYAFWLSPNKDMLEVIIEGQSKYGKIAKDGFTKIFSILETP